MTASCGRLPEVNGHAGAAGFYRKNSAASIQKALDLGVDRIEIDVVATRDRHLVLRHDLSLLDGGQSIPIEFLSLEELRACEPEILSLDEAIEIVGYRTPFLVDIKGRGYEDILIRAFGEMQRFGPVSACSTHGRSLKAIRHALPRIPLGLSRGHSLTKVPDRRARRLAGAAISIGQVPTLFSVAKWCGATEIMLQHHLCNHLLMWIARLQDLHVNVWTVDSPADIDRAIALGVDSITSNRPDLVMDALNQLR